MLRLHALYQHITMELFDTKSVGQHDSVCVISFLCYRVLKAYKINVEGMKITLCYQGFTLTEFVLKEFHCRKK